MIEPLPKWRSIWVSAASRAFACPWTILQRDAGRANLYGAPYGRDLTPRQRGLAALPESTDSKIVHYLFSVRNMFF